MTLNLNDRAALMACWDALAQYVENTDPDESDIIGAHAEHAAAIRLMQEIDAYVATLAE